MKKCNMLLLVFSLVLLVSATTSFAQLKGISIGGNVVFPTGDWADIAKTGYGGSATYEHPIKPQVAGVLYVGYLSFSGDEGFDWSMIPMMAGAKFYFSESQSWYLAALLGANYVTAENSITVGNTTEDFSESSTEFAANANLGYEIKIGEKGALDICAGFVWIDQLSYYGLRLAYKFGF